jgi:hypothetical protein
MRFLICVLFSLASLASGFAADGFGAEVPTQIQNGTATVSANSDGSITARTATGQPLGLYGATVGNYNGPYIFGAIATPAVSASGQANLYYDGVRLYISIEGGAYTALSNSGTVTSVATAGTVSGLTLTGGPITGSGTITLGGALTGFIATPNGSGTGITITTGTYGGQSVLSGTFTGAHVIAGVATHTAGILGTTGSNSGLWQFGAGINATGTATLATATVTTMKVGSGAAALSTTGPLVIHEATNANIYFDPSGGNARFFAADDPNSNYTTLNMESLSLGLNRLSNNPVVAGTGLFTLTGGAIIGTGQTVTFKSSGANQPIMTGTLSSGAVTFSNTLITGSSVIIPTDIGGSVVNVGSLYVSAQTTGTATISSSNALDASTVKILILGGN